MRKQRRWRKQQRQYYRTAALFSTQPRAVARRPARPWPGRIPWRALLPALLLLGAGLWVWLDAHWYVDASRLEVVGASSLETARQVALASETLGIHAGWLRPQEIVARVANTVPSVAWVELYCWPYPARCVLTVEEREPRLAWLTGEGLYWMDGAGHLQPAWGERPDLPLVRGPLPETEQAALAVLSGMEALSAVGIPEDELVFHPQRGLTWADEHGCQVAFGTGGEMTARWRSYRLLRADFERRGLAPRQIDVRFPLAPTYALVRTW